MLFVATSLGLSFFQIATLNYSKHKNRFRLLEMVTGLTVIRQTHNMRFFLYRERQKLRYGHRRPVAGLLKIAEP